MNESELKKIIKNKDYDNDQMREEIKTLKSIIQRRESTGKKELISPTKSKVYSIPINNIIHTKEKFKSSNTLKRFEYITKKDYNHNQSEYGMLTPNSNYNGDIDNIDEIEMLKDDLLDPYPQTFRQKQPLENEDENDEDVNSKVNKEGDNYKVYN